MNSPSSPSPAKNEDRARIAAQAVADVVRGRFSDGLADRPSIEELTALAEDAATAIAAGFAKLSDAGF